PRPHGTAVPGGGYLAYRLQGLQARRLDSLRVEWADPKDFPAFFWQAAGRGEPPAYTCRILREPGDARDRGPSRPARTLPVLRLAVEPRPLRREGTLDVAWQLGSPPGAGDPLRPLPRAPGVPRRAQFRASLDLSAPEGDLALVEWHVPAG